VAPSTLPHNQRQTRRGQEGKKVISIVGAQRKKGNGRGRREGQNKTEEIEGILNNNCKF